MDDELRKAAGTAVDVWDDTGTRHEDVVNAMNDLRKVLAKNANAAPDSSLAPIIESLIGKYWDIAYEEGKTGISQGDLANQVLGRIRNALIAWAQRAAPQDQDAKDAARWRFLTQQMDESEVDYFLYCFDASDWASRRSHATGAKAMTQVCMPDVCKYCVNQIRWWQRWVGISTQEVGTQWFWKERAHFKCWQGEQKP